MRWIKRIARRLKRTGPVSRRQPKDAALDQQLVQDRYRLAMLAVRDGVWDWSLDGNTVAADARCFEMLGQPAAALEQGLERWLERLHPRDADAVVPVVQRQVHSDGAFMVQFRLATASGGWLWVECRGRVVAREQKRPARVIGTLTDISARKEAELALEDERRRLAWVIEGTHVGTWEWDIPSGATWFNERWADIVGYTLDELSPTTIGTWAALAHPDDLDLSSQLLRRHFSGEIPYYECECRMRHKDGSWVWVLDRGKVIEWDDGGHPVRMCGTHADISRRKRAEAIFLEERNLFVGGPVMVFRWRPMPGWPIEYVSPNFHSELGHPVEHWLNRDFADLVHPDDLVRIGREVEAHIAARHHTYEQEYRVLRADGTYRWVYDFTRLVWNRDWGLETIQGYLMDHSAHRRAQEDLQRSNAELEQFAYVASHDLRQPLRMVKSYTQLLERKLGARLEADEREFFAFVADGATHMDRMLVSLLEYSRIGRRGDPMEALDSRAAAESALRFLEPAVAEAQAEIHLDGVWPTVQASPTELVRLFQNLIGNAIKYRAPDRPPRVHLTAEPMPGGWRFSVSDNGIGIPADQVYRLFKVFQRLHGTDEYEGVGIGLASCRKIVERHGGEIWIEPQGDDGTGSTIRFTLPAIGGG